MSFDLSIILINHRQCDLSIQCLESIYRHIGSVHAQIILVNNSPDDNCSSKIALAYPDVLRIDNSTPNTFGQNNNIGLQQARGRYVLFLNNDTIVQPEALESMVNFLDSHPEAGATTVQLQSSSGLPERIFQEEVSLGEEIRRHLVALNINVLSDSQQYMKKSPLEPYTVLNISGACFCARKILLEQIGGFDEVFRFYYEDIDLSLRIRKAGFLLYCIPNKSIIHLGGGTLAYRLGYAIEEYRSACYFLKKHRKAGPFSFLVMKLVFTLNALMRCLAYLALSLLKGKIAWNRSVMYARLLLWHFGLRFGLKS